MSGQSPSKRPRLSLQIKALSTSPGLRASRSLAAVVNPRSPTSFNTLSNVYSTAVDRSASTPVLAEPITAIAATTATASTSKRPPSLPRLQVPDGPASQIVERRAQTPYVTTQFPETPLTARPLSPTVSMEMVAFPGTMTATPPLSAGPVDADGAHVFCFSPDSMETDDAMGLAGPETEHADPAAAKTPVTAVVTTSPAFTPATSSSSATATATTTPSDRPSSQAPAPRRRSTALTPVTGRPAPYEHPRTLHSILLNSPLPPRTARTPVSPRRQSQRLLERASRHVMYHSPLTQTITTNTYTQSHIDLLESSDETSPQSTGDAAVAGLSPTPHDAMALDLALAYDGHETRDGGATPGPFEEMRRRLAGLDTANTPVSPTSAIISPTSAIMSPTSAVGGAAGGIHKRRPSRREKKRRWVWTLGQDEEEEATLSGAMAALKAALALEAAAAAAGGGEATKDMPMKDAAALPAETAEPPPTPTVETDAAQTTAQTAAQTAAQTGAPPAPPAAGQPTTSRKRKSTPVPYAVDDDDVDMQTPTAVVEPQLEGVWMRAAAAAAGQSQGEGASGEQPQCTQ